ncbi:MAG: phosphoglucosamine mutase, partial [Salinivirgaceae bacterium]|nr:phosphoglucosamine mutase [Salinivirgaceae bacterium]
MSLIKSISGIRGTIGDKVGEGLSPIDIVKFTAAYSQWVKEQNAGKNRLRIVVGRDARISGTMVSHIVLGTLVSMGMDVIDIDLATTPTTELAVTHHNADGGLILTASHNPKQWNALKLLNRNGEFLSAADGNRVLEIAEKELYTFVDVDSLGHIEQDLTFNAKHVAQVVDLPLVDVEAIRKANFKVVFDSIKSVGGLILPELFKALGVTNVVGLNTEPTGNFFHTPEPLPENLGQISAAMREQKADVGFVVDPDVDRLAIVCEDGSMFGEEYTL